MVFSLMCFITIFAFAFVVPSAMAAEFGLTVAGRTAARYILNAQGTEATAAVVVDLTVSADQRIPALVRGNTPAVTDNVNLTFFDRDGFVISATDAGAVTVVDLPKSSTNAQDAVYPERTAKKRKLRITLPVGSFPEIANVIVEVEALETTDPRIAAADSMSTSVFHTITFSGIPSDPNNVRPRVVSIQRLRPSSQSVVSAFEERQIMPEPFDVRIVLTEKPHDFKLATINVEGGTASNLVIGVPFAIFTTDASDPMKTVTPHPSEGMYEHSLAGVPSGVVGSGTVPLPSGPDEMYHQYRVTITPYRRVGMVKVSVKEFNDGGSPFLNIYKPLNLDYKPNGREQLRLAVATPTMPPETGVMISLPHDDDVKITEKQKADATAADAAETVAAEKVKAEAATVAVEKAVDTSVMIPEDGQIYISEIMFAGGGILPQWIEISNGSKSEEVNLSGWTLTVENATADADVSVGASAVFTIPEGTRIDPSGQHDTPSTVLVVTEQGRNNLTGAMADGQVVNLWTDQQLELFRLDIFKRRYSLLSDMAFK